MAGLREMLEAGYVPKLGSNFLQKIGQQMKFQQIEEERQRKELSDRFDMYKTLRQAGYEPKLAFEAAGMKGKAPMPMDEADIDTQQKKAELAKTKEETTSIISERERKDRLSELPTQQRMHAIILDDIINGRTLTPGKQRIYDETMKKGAKALGISPNQAISILSDPIKSNEIKENYPDFFSKLEEISKEALGGETEQPIQQIEELPEGVSEEDIEFTMKKHKLTREEVLKKLRK